VLPQCLATALHGQLDCLRLIYVYLKQNPTGPTRFCTHIPNHERVLIQFNMIYVHPYTEEVPPAMHTPQGKRMHKTTYQDSNFYHYLATGRFMS
jgi:hypothetical protein